MGRRKEYPWNLRDDKQTTNFISSLLALTIFTPFLLCSSSKNKDLDIGEVIGVIFLSILLLPFILLTPSIWDVLYGFDFIIRLLLLLLSYVLIGCIEAYLIYKAFTIVDKLENKYDSFVYYIVLISYKSRYRNIRKDYFNTVSKNKRAKPKVVELRNKIKHYQNLLEKNIGTEKEQKYRNLIEDSQQELYQIKKNLFNVFRTDFKDPVIELPCTPRNTLPDFEGYVYLSIDNKFTVRRTIKLKEIVPLGNYGKIFFKTNIKSVKSFFNEFITIHFYNGYLLLMTKNDFTIIGYEDITVSYIKTTIELCLGNKNYSQSIKLDRLDCIPEFRKDKTNEFVMLDVGTLQLNFFSRKINLLFSKCDEGKVIYELISNNK